MTVRGATAAVLGGLFGAVLGGMLGVFLVGLYVDQFMPNATFESLGPLQVGIVGGAIVGGVATAMLILRRVHR